MRDLQRLDCLTRTAATQVDAAQQQVRLGKIGGQVQHAAQLVDRLAIVLRVEEPAPAIEVKRHHFGLLALAGGHERGFGAGPARRIDRGARPLEPAWHTFAGPAVFTRMLCGKPLRELQFTGRLRRTACHLQRRTEDEMRVAIGGVSPDSFPQPVDRGRHILFEPVGVPEVEEIVGIRRRLRALVNQ